MGRAAGETAHAGLFITATDTGVGKTILTAALLAAMAQDGVPATALKPVLTGTAEAPDGGEHDHELLARVGGLAAEEVAPFTFPLAASPHLAAEAAGRPLEGAQLIAVCRKRLAQAQERGQLMLVEGVGGLLVPLTDDLLVRDLLCELQLPALIAARPTLGTINHTLLTLAAARAASIEVAAVVLTPWPSSPGPIERSNRATITRLGAVEVAVLPALGDRSPGALAAAGGALPWRRWCS
ncbi:MAG TPA: dethiobiotin synthase [Solirubrobacteraceae bacterium]|nr:dethiobiotin synthase [Solirubrobacteraceae bacterium]